MLYFSIVLLSVLTLKDVIAVTFVLICVVVSSVFSVMSEQSDGVPHRLGISDSQISSFLYKCIYRILQFGYQTSNTVVLYYSVIYRVVRTEKNLAP